MAKVNLAKLSTRAPSKLIKEETKKETEKLLGKLDNLQNLLFAENKHAILVILQGMDASGKDGVVRNVFTSINPAGCRVISFKAPTPLEMKHDFLWRIHQNVPESGMIHVFNRSHYEDVLIQRVHHWVNEATIAKRFEHINCFEKLLQDSGTTVLKFYLHISKEEQLKRLKERMSVEEKMWKYNANDLKERRYWDSYRKAYEDVFLNCSSSAPWHVVPSDQNWYKEYFIAKKVVEALESFKMNYPGLKK